MELKPRTRKEFLIANFIDKDTPDIVPKTRTEMFLKQMLDKISSGAGGVSSWNDLTDKPFYEEESGTVEVLAETTVREVPKMGHTADANFGSLGLEVGKRYTVTIDGVDYEFEAWGANAGTISIVGIGSGDGVGFSSGDGDLGWGEFGAVDIHDGSNEVCILEIARYGGITEDECIDRNISITTEGTVTHPIEGKYLPKGTPYVQENELLKETDATGITHPTFGQMWAVYGGIPNLKAGETYTITYNGTDYKCVCQAAPAGLIDDPNAVAMGNFSAVGGENTGEPFGMLISYDYQEIDIIDLVGSSAVNVEISGTTIQKMDSRCLPDVMTVHFDMSSQTADKNSNDIYAEIQSERNVFMKVSVGDASVYLSCAFSAPYAAVFLMPNVTLQGDEVTGVNGFGSICVKPDGSVLFEV